MRARQLEEARLPLGFAGGGGKRGGFRARSRRQADRRDQRFRLFHEIQAGKGEVLDSGDAREFREQFPDRDVGGVRGDLEGGEPAGAARRR